MIDQTTSPNEERLPRISRRSLLHSAIPAALTIIPRRVLGGAGYVPPSDKVNIACIGVGSQGLRVMLGFLKETDVQIVSVCDVNRESSDYPQWGSDEFRNSVRRLLGDNVPDWVDRLSTNTPIQLTRTMTSTGGAAGWEPCRKIVDAYYSRQTRSGSYKACTAYSDFRELLEKEKGVDAVIVGTTDHWHAHVSIAAMKRGKHVYCQKPMTHTVYEARRMAEVAREAGVATQVAVGNAASEETRVLCEWIWAGAIGPVRRVSNWSSRPFWPQGIERPREEMPVPEGLDWDLWLGPSAFRPYHCAYLPFIWRGWYDFGTGAIGDMGCYSFDTIFRVLKLEAPVSVESSCTELYEESYPKASIIHWAFPARGDMPSVEVTWYDGGLKPPTPDELLENRQSLEKEGLMFLGDKGTILCGFNGRDPRLIPEAKMKAFTPPPKTLPRSSGHNREWLDACRGAGPLPGANFEFEAKVTEAILLGNVAQRVGSQLLWDSASLKAANTAAAERYIRPEYRQGWNL